MRLIVFDIDGTLIAGPTTEKRFFAYLARTGNLGPRQVLAFLAFIIRWAGRYGRHIFKKDKAYLAWLREDKVRRLATQWAGRDLEAAWFHPCVRRLRKHQAEGDQIVLLSGTPDFVAEAIAARLGVTTAVGSRCVVRDGRFRAQPPELHPFADAKLAIARQLCEHYGVELRQVVAYADSGHDLPLLEQVGTPVAVRPDGNLLETARQRNWEILGERPVLTFSLLNPG